MFGEQAHLLSQDGFWHTPECQVKMSFLSEGEISQVNDTTRYEILRFAQNDTFIYVISSFIKVFLYP
jgi:hypothetical protein